MRANPRRLRLHQRLSGRKILPRRETLHYRRRHKRNSEVGDCPAAPRQEIISGCAWPGRESHRKAMPQSIENWAERVCAGEVRAISQAITAIENHEANA